MHDKRAFTMCDETYFLGVVALLNSLRITGNTMPVTVVDRGMVRWQRQLLEPHCDLAPARSGVNPYLLKPDAPMASDADVVVLLDSDVIVAGSLDGMVADAAAGHVCAFVDQMDHRWFAEWHDLLGLRAPLRREPYVNAGAIAVSKVRLPDFFPRWVELLERVQGRPTMYESEARAADPLWLADQDPLNALLLSELPTDAVIRYPRPAMVLGAANLAHARVDDSTRLRCSCDGEEVVVLHAAGRIKPWHHRARREYRRTAYTIGLRRALAGPDLTVQVPAPQLPPWLRPGTASVATAWALHGYDVVARATRPLRRRLRLSSGQEPVPSLGG